MARPIPSITLAVLLAASGEAAAQRAPGFGADIFVAGRGGASTLVIAYAASLEEAAQRWAAYRAADGWSVQLERVEPWSGPMGDLEPTEQAEELKRRLVRRYRGHVALAGGDLAVLLLGDVAADGIATWRAPQPDPLLQDARDRAYATDHPYRCLDGDDDEPDVALGRVPAASVGEALAVLEKIERYEREAPRGPWRRRVNYAAGEGHFGRLDLVLELLFRNMVERSVPEPWDLTVTYAKPGSLYCPAPSALTATLQQRLAEGCLLFNYVGHGSDRGFDRLHYGGHALPLLEMSDIARLPDEGSARPIALLTCCSAGWYDGRNGRRSIAETMLLHPGGPIAVVAGSRPTHPYANTIFQKHFTDGLLVHRLPTVGAVDLAADRALRRRDGFVRQLDLVAAPLALAQAWSSSLGDLRRTHVELYNLLGDPATRIAYPEAEIAELSLEQGCLSGAVDGLSRGRALITIETARASVAHPEALLPVLAHDDPRFAERAAHNYALANDRVLWRGVSAVSDGRLETTLPHPLPEGADVVRIYVVGLDEHDGAYDAFGAVKVEGGLESRK